MRQTNFVWVAFIAVDSLLDKFGSNREENLVQETFSFAKKSFCNFWWIFKNYFGFILVAISFASFLLWNGSIVIGDKEAHKASLHFPQFLYFALISAGFLSPHILFLHFPRFLKNLKFSNLLFNSFLFVVISVLGYYSVKKYT